MDDGVTARPSVSRNLRPTTLAYESLAPVQGAPTTWNTWTWFPLLAASKVCLSIAPNANDDTRDQNR